VLIDRAERAEGAVNAALTRADEAVVALEAGVSTRPLFSST
jgi:hypothetical protein